MSFNGGRVVFTKDGVLELPSYIEVLSKEKVKVKIDSGWEGKHIVTVTPEDIRKMADDLGYGIYTKSCIVYFGVAWDWRRARDLINEIHYLFKLLKENGYEKN